MNLPTDIYVSNGSMDLDQCMETIQLLMSRIDTFHGVELVIDEGTGNPPEKGILPIITFDLVRRIITPKIARLEPTLFDTHRDTENPDAIIKTYRQWFDCTIDFHVHHQTAREARILMQDFEDLLETYKDYLKENGISELQFIEEISPTISARGQLDVPTRTLRYLVRIERTRTVRSNTILNTGTVTLQLENGSTTKEIPLHQRGREKRSVLIDSYRAQTRTDG